MNNANKKQEVSLQSKMTCLPERLPPDGFLKKNSGHEKREDNAITWFLLVAILLMLFLLIIQLNNIHTETTYGGSRIQLLVSFPALDIIWVYLRF